MTEETLRDYTKYRYDELLELARDNDMLALAELYRKLKPSIMRHCQWKLGRYHDPE